MFVEQKRHLSSIHSATLEHYKEYILSTICSVVLELMYRLQGIYVFSGAKKLNFQKKYFDQKYSPTKMKLPKN